MIAKTMSLRGTMGKESFARATRRMLSVALALGLALTFPGCAAGKSDSSPEERADLVVYLLEGRDTATQGIANVESSLRQLAATFEDAEGLSVEVRVGIPADSGVTADDAQRALNASLLAGDGPDVIVLDGLPLDRMAQQGMLLNLADARDLLLGSDSFYENILFGLGDASDYAVPTSFSLPVIEGSENLLDRFTTASDLVELVAVDPSAAEALGVDSGLSDLLAASYPAIVSHGTLDRRALSAFLENADTLLKAAQANYDRCQIALGEGGGDYDAIEYGIDALTTTASSASFSTCALFLDDATKLQIGSVDSWEVFGHLYLNQEETPYPCQFRPFRETNATAFTPLGILGVSATSEHPEESKRFIAHALAAEAQKNVQGIGIPVNETACDEFTRLWDGGYSILFAEEDGTTTEYRRDPLSPSEIEHCKELIASADTASLPDRVVVEAMADALRDYSGGNASLEETADAAAQKIDLYLKQ